MKLIAVRLRNFRGFRDSGRIPLGDMTAFVGENDVGKSSVLEALDVFFNEKEAEAPLTGDDFNVVGRTGSSPKLEIRCFFSGCGTFAPEKEGEDTLSLEEEGLLNRAGELEIVKRFTRSGGSVSQKPETFLCSSKRFTAVRADGSKAENLLDFTVSELYRLCREIGVPATTKMTASELRKAIRNAKVCKVECSRAGDFEFPVKSKAGQFVWSRIAGILPLFNLFRSDRENSDAEDVVQFPIKAAIRDCFGKHPFIWDKLNEIAAIVSDSIGSVMKRTIEKVAEFDPKAVTTLMPSMPKTSELKWMDVFKSVALKSGDQIAINRRGSGVKRLVLLGFFKARAESPENDGRDVIFAVEEPETAQHFEHQRQLTDALRKLSKRNGTQVLLTTHSPVVVSRLSLEDIRTIRREDGAPIVGKIDGNLLLVPKRTSSSGNIEVSMNEVNYLVFGECRSEYHDELFGHLDEHYGTGDDHSCKILRKNRPASQAKTWNRKGKNPGPEEHSLSYYIRNYVHHPESRGTDNPAPTDEEWRKSIAFMRSIIENGGKVPKNSRKESEK